jgi:glycosyltransferase involved in cell wall biosynthesis
VRLAALLLERDHVRILLLNHCPLESVPVLRNLGSLLSERGHEVEVIAYAQHPPSMVTESVARVREHAIYRGGGRISLRPLRAAIRFCRFASASWRITSEHEPDLVIAFNYDSLALAFALGRRHSRVIYYVLEYSDAPRAHDYWTGWAFLKLLERWLVGRSDFIVSVDVHRAALQAREWDVGMPLVIPNAPRFDGAIQEAAEARLASKRSGPLRLVYAGTVGESNLIRDLVTAVRRMDGEALLDIYGPVAATYEGEFAALLGQRVPGADPVNFLGGLIYGDLPSVLVEYDVGVVLYGASADNSVNVQLASPAKLFEYMKAGLAVLATSQPMPRHVIGASGAGWVLGDVAALEPTLFGMVADADEVRRRGRLGLVAFREQFCFEIVARALLERIDELSENQVRTAEGRSWGRSLVAGRKRTASAMLEPARRRQTREHESSNPRST